MTEKNFRHRLFGHTPFGPSASRKGGSVFKMPSVEVFMTAKNELVPTTGNEVVPAQRVDSPKYVELVSRYRSFAKHTAKNLVGLLATLMEAEAVLPTSEFELFCREVKLAGSTLRKWKSMAKKRHDFCPSSTNFQTTGRRCIGWRE